MDRLGGPWDDNPGTLRGYVPGLGLIMADCAANGMPYLDPDTVLRLADKPDELRLASGKPWLDHIAELRARFDGGADHLMNLPNVASDS